MEEREDIGLHGTIDRLPALASSIEYWISDICLAYIDHDVEILEAPFPLP